MQAPHRKARARTKPVYYYNTTLAVLPCVVYPFFTTSVKPKSSKSSTPTEDRALCSSSTVSSARVGCLLS